MTPAVLSSGGRQSYGPLQALTLGRLVKVLPPDDD